MSNDPNNRGFGRTLGGAPAEPLPDSWARPAEQRRVGRIGDWAGSGTSGDGRNNSNFGTLGSMGDNAGGRTSGGHDDHDDGEDDNEDKRESWFAGGERSGISVENPNSRRPVPGGNAVRDLLQRAAEGGVAPEEISSASRRGAFSGSGHTLGSDEVPSTLIPDPHAVDSDDEPAIRQITFWRDGFTVEDGELMRYDDPNNAQILAEINSGHAPPSILNVRTGQPVDLRIAQRTTEDYVPPKGKKAFAGSGHRLGAPVPSDARSSENIHMPGSFPITSSSNPAAPEREVERLTPMFEVDQTLPTTSIQLRLADGTRMVCRMNLTHTVGDIRNFINASRPENIVRPYTIGTTFPNRTLDDDAATIGGAGLVNSVIVQRWV